MSEVVDKIVAEVAGPVAEASRAACQSRTLRQALRVERTADGFRLTVPHYWAVFYAHGRGSITARPGKKLVYYRNPAEDPRLAGGYPVRLSDVRRLTKGEFYRDLKAGRLIVTDRVGPAAPHEFMGDVLTHRAANLVAEQSAAALTQATRDALGPLFKIKVETVL